MTLPAAFDRTATATAAPALFVGDWQVEPSLNQVSRAGQVVRLEPKAMALLLHLAARPRQVVSREELLAAVWPGVVVGDNALTQAVAKLRRALGDTSREAAYVQAVAKKGYRLVAPVRQAAPVAGDAPTSPAPMTPRAAAPGVLAALGILVLAAILGGLALRPQVPPRPEMPPAAAESVRSTPPTVQVEPFRDLNADAQPGAIGRGLSADLATDLSKVAGLSVIAAAPAPAKADGAPRARYVLSGTVQQQGDRLRLNVVLTDTESKRLLWSERFDRELAQLFEVQDSLVRRVLEVLPVKVSEAETLRLAQRSTRNLAAYENFVQAQAALLVRRPAQNEAARTLYWAAIARDPAFARAYAGLALTHALDYQQGWTQDGGKALDRAREFALTALRLRPDMPEAQWVMAFVDTQRRRLDDALRALDEALRLRPSYADAYALKAGIHTYLGQPAQSVALLQKALQLNPDGGSLYLLLLGRAYFFLGDMEQARFNLARTLDRNPENLEARLYLAVAAARAGDGEAATWQVGEIRSLEPGFSAEAWMANYPLDAAEARSGLLSALQALGL